MWEVLVDKIFVLGLALILTFEGPVQVEAKSTYKSQYSQICITESDSIQKYNEYDIPEEVQTYINEILSSKPNAEVIIDLPGNSNLLMTSSGFWNPVRTYNGHLVKDWVVHITNCFSMTNIRNGVTAKNFASMILVNSSGILLDRIVPFGSAGITIAQYIFGNGTVTAGSGDKVNAAPQYESYSKFTYVNIGGTYQLGAETHMAKLKSVSWFYYNAASDSPSTKIYTYNSTFYKTTHYDNPDAIALSGVGMGGYIEPSIYITLGTTQFTLE